MAQFSVGSLQSLLFYFFMEFIVELNINDNQKLVGAVISKLTALHAVEPDRHARLTLQSVGVNTRWLDVSIGQLHGISDLLVSENANQTEIQKVIDASFNGVSYGNAHKIPVRFKVTVGDFDTDWIDITPHQLFGMKKVYSN